MEKSLFNYKYYEYGRWTMFVFALILLFFAFTYGERLNSWDGKFSSSPPASAEEVEQLFIKYSDQFKKPSTEEVKTDIEKEFRAISPKKEEKALNLYKRGDLEYDERRFYQALFFFAEVLRTIESSSVYLATGNTMFFLGRHDEALDVYDKALNIKPDYVEAWYNKGNVLSALGRNEEAIKHYDKALEILESVNSPNGKMVRDENAN